jgi:hypothetical protein
MSLADTMTPLVSTPWLGADGEPAPAKALPGLGAEVVHGLECSFPGIIRPAYRAFLQACSGIAVTELGSIDFTGCWFPEEPCSVFQPCLTLAIDAAGRRWIGEIGDKELPGPIWCVFPDPKVALYVSEDLAAFIATLRDCASGGGTPEWLQNLSTQARTVWARRHALARRPYELHESDEQIRGWLAGLPFDAYVYDLRKPTIARGWPYGLAGASGRLYRCGRLPVFAVAGSPSEAWRQEFSTTIPTHVGGKAREFVGPSALRDRRTPQSQPAHPIRSASIERAFCCRPQPRIRRSPSRAWELRRCA